MSSSAILVLDVDICAVECWKQALFCCMIWPCLVPILGQWEFCQSIFYLGSSFCGVEVFMATYCSGSVISFSLSPLLTFFCLLKERGLFLYLLTVTAGCGDTLFQRLSSDDLPTGPWPLREIWKKCCAPCSRGMSCTHCCAILLLLYFHYTRHPALLQKKIFPGKKPPHPSPLKRLSHFFALYCNQKICMIKVLFL